MPLPSSSPSLDAFTRRNEATVIREASLFGNSKTKLKQAFSKRNKIVRKRIYNTLKSCDCKAVLFST